MSQEELERAEAALACGDAPTAIALCEAMLDRDRQDPAIWEVLGKAWVASNRPDDAIAAYCEALDIDADRLGTRCCLARLLVARGRVDEAALCLLDAIADPEAADPTAIAGITAALHDCGAAFFAMRDLDGAIACFQELVRLAPARPEYHCSLGAALGEALQYEEAIACFQGCLRLDPTFLQAHLNLGSLRARMKDPEGAIACFRYALDLDPNAAEAWERLASLHAELDDWHNALPCCDRALALDPERPQAYRLQQLALPALYDTPAEIEAWRARFVAGLERFETKVSQVLAIAPARALGFVCASTNFYLAYQGRDDRDLQARYGRLLHRIMAANLPQWVESLPLPSDTGDRPLRLGYVSECLRDHVVGKLLLGWLRHRDRDRFHVTCYYTEQPIDEVTAIFQRESNAFHQIPRHIPAMAAQIARDRPDILIYPALGMHAPTLLLAALRLAPIQCAAWGHPVTSGLPTIDYFLTSAAMEAPDGDRHYTERLVRLPNLGFSYPRPVLPPNAKQRRDFGLQEDACVFLCVQSLFKYLPHRDRLWAEIARRVPHAHFVFLGHQRSPHLTARFQHRLDRAFATAGLSARDYCTMLPRCSEADYLALNQLADIFLDSLDWSGGVTTLEAIACGLPVVTCPGEFLRGRHACGILRVLGVTETIAATETEYIDLAVRLATDRSWRAAIVARMQENGDRLFDDLTCVMALEEWCEGVVLPERANST